jgi:hypothetical protein
MNLLLEGVVRRLNPHPNWRSAAPYYYSDRFMLVGKNDSRRATSALRDPLSQSETF